MVPEHNVATITFAEGGWSTRLTRKCNVATAGLRGNGKGDPAQWNAWDYEPMAGVIQMCEMCTLYAVRMQCEKNYFTAFCGHRQRLITVHVWKSFTYISCTTTCVCMRVCGFIFAGVHNDTIPTCMCWFGYRYLYICSRFLVNELSSTSTRL